MKLSIIVPVYNVENYLAKCLDSLIYTGLSNYELIIVNDGSTDGSLTIAQSYAESHPELIRLFSKENGGLGHARMYGLERALGEYVLFVDSDDYLTPNAVAEILDLLQDDADMYIYDFHAVDEAGRELKYYQGYKDLGEVNLKNNPDLINAMPNAFNKICKRELFINNNISYPDRLWYEDLHVASKLYLQAKTIICVHKLWYNYLQRAGSIMRTANLGRNLEIIIAVDSVIDYYKNQTEYENYYNELMFLAFYNQYLTASTRVALIDHKSPVLRELRENFLRKFPDFTSSANYKNMPAKWKLLYRLIYMRQYKAVAMLMRMNNIIKK